MHSSCAQYCLWWKCKHDPWTSMYWFYTRKENKLFCETYRGWMMSEEISHFSNWSACIVKQKNSWNTINNSITKWKFSAPDIQELLLLAASSKMRLLPWLANPCSPAMSPCAEGKKGTCHTDVINTEETRKSRGRSNLETMLAPRTVLQQTWGIHAHVDNRRLLTAQAYQH